MTLSWTEGAVGCIIAAFAVASRSIHRGGRQLCNAIRPKLTAGRAFRLGLGWVPREPRFSSCTGLLTWRAAGQLGPTGRASARARDGRALHHEITGRARSSSRGQCSRRPRQARGGGRSPQAQDAQRIRPGAARSQVVVRSAGRGRRGLNLTRRDATRRALDVDQVPCRGP